MRHLHCFIVTKQALTDYANTESILGGGHTEGKFASSLDLFSSPHNVEQRERESEGSRGAERWRRPWALVARLQRVQLPQRGQAQGHSGEPQGHAAGAALPTRGGEDRSR